MIRLNFIKYAKYHSAILTDIVFNVSLAPGKEISNGYLMIGLAESIPVMM